VEDNEGYRGASYGGDGVSFVGALVAVFLAGAISGALVSFFDASQVRVTTTTLIVSVVASLVIGALAIKMIVSLMGATVSLPVAVVAMLIGTVLPLVTLSSRLHSQTGHSSPRVLPFVGVGVTAITGFVGIGILLGQAWVVQTFSRRASY
jgi:hypothetical protein